MPYVMRNFLFRYIYFQTEVRSTQINGLFWSTNGLLYEIALIIILRTLLFLLLTSFSQIPYKCFCKLVGLV